MKNEKGVAIIMMLVLTAALMIILSAAATALHALANQNKTLKQELNKTELRVPDSEN
ncbi:MAG: hypothetical protein JW808_07615 [Victivallales bacterium]|nr:hypothetical protein [Victivallales bacterium]